ncbi:transposase [Streptomyces sp. NPDC090093]|uniref:transposase n=1 Tax=Streptomyces sp. NPDC090093 TaxID=3365945 RepID=UPI003817CFD6
MATGLVERVFLQPVGQLMDVSIRLVIADAMWGRIEPLMPDHPVHDRRWADHCQTLQALMWKYRTCSPWQDLPDELGWFQTAHKGLTR